MTMSAGALLLATLMFVAVWRLTRGTPLRDQTAPAQAETPARPRPPVARPAPPPRVEAPVARPAPPSENEIHAAFVRVNRIALRNNVAGLVAAVFSNSGRVREAEEMREVLLKGDLEIRKEGEKLPPIAPYIEPGDVLFAFDTTVLDPAAPLRFADELQKRLRDLQVGTMLPVSVRRRDRRISLSIQISEFGPEVTDLLARVGAPAAPATPPAAPPEVQPLPPALVQDIRLRLRLLPAAYASALTVEEGMRLQRLLAQGEGTAADGAFLQKTVQAELLPRVEEEHRTLKLRAAELTAKLKSAPGNDTVVFKDGRKLRGKIEEVTEDAIRFRGTLGVVRYLRSEILRIERLDSASEFDALFQAAGGKPDPLLPLVEWCRSKNLATQKELVCCTLLIADPSRPEARKELGLPPLSGTRR
jgi:hypothetical protein